MSANRKKNTSPERRLRSALHRLGLRYRIHAKPIQGSNMSADVVFRPSRVAVFLDGCFWHGCETHGTWPAVNREYWRAKISGNVLRDRRVDDLLAQAGWNSIRVWEHESSTAAANRIFETVRLRLPRLRSGH
ncbi:MAG TPA: very short patch repair endonuclease [Chloroflexi bacterium]|nr:very short patch repair endonuclease [Chloroflexota bacterium]HCG02976.1 very short patch repair endonuclease [Chloroflexota bacterium]